MSVDFVLKGINVVRDFSAKSQSGLTWTSDQITYPHDLGQVPDDAYPHSKTVAYFYKEASLFAGDRIAWGMHGNFRPFFQLVEGDPNSITPPVIANVYVGLDSVDKADRSELEIHFKALETPYGTPEDPRIRFLCEGHYDAAGTGECTFRAVVEIDANANVTCVEGPQITGGEGQISDSSPNGFYLNAVGPDHSVVL
jgi:hypothetical protein